MLVAIILGMGLIIGTVMRVGAESPISIVYNVGVAPLKFEDASNRPSGIFPELWRLWAEKTGREIQFVKTDTFGASLELLKKGAADLHAGLFKTPEREQYLDYSLPVLKLDYYLHTHPSIRAISDIKDTSGLLIGSISSGYEEEWLRERVPASRIILYPTLEALFNGAIQGEVKVFLESRISLLYYLSQNRMNNIFICDIKKPIFSQTYHTAVIKGNAWLLDAVNKGLRAISQEEMARIESAWIVRHENPIPTAFASILTAEERSFLAKMGSLKVHNESDWAPFSFNIDGVAKGFSIDYMDLLAKKCGLEIAYVNGPSWNDFMAMMKTGALDVMLNIARSPEREEFLAFAPSYITMNQVLYTRREFPLVMSIKDLNGKRFAVQKGLFIVDVLKKYPQIQVVEVADTTAAIYAVSTGKADALFDLMPVVSYLARQLQITNLKVGGDIGIVEGKPVSLHMAVARDEPLLAGILEKGMLLITDDERMALHRKWLGTENVPSSDSDLTFVPAEVAAARVNLTDRERYWLSRHGKIRLADDFSRPPFSFLDKRGRFAGIASGYAEVISARLGVEIEPIIGLTWREAMGKIEAGEIDVAPALVRTEALEKVFNFTNPYISLPIVMATRKEGLFVDRLDDLAGRSVGVVEGSVAEASLIANHPALALAPFARLEDGLESLSAGRIDAFVDNLGSITWEMDQRGFDLIKIAAPTPYGFDLRIGVRKDLPELTAILNKALESIDDRKQTEIKNTWMAVEIRYGPDIRKILIWTLPMGIAGVALILFVVIWNRKLAVQVRERTLAEQKINAMSSAIHDGMIMIDGKARVMYWNQAAEALFGIPAAEALGRDMHTLVAPADYIEKARAGLETFSDTGRGAVLNRVSELTARRSDGTHFPAEVGVAGFQVDRGWYAVGIVRDITERKKAEAALKDSEQRLEMALTASNTGLWDWYPQEGKDFHNDQWYRQLGYERHELDPDADHLMTLMHPEDAVAFLNSMEKYADSALDDYKNEFRMKAMDGSWKWILSLGRIIDRDEAGRPSRIVGVHLDMTERKTAEDKIRRHLEDLERFNKLAIGREEKMIQLKEEINQLLREAGRETRYRIV